MCCLVRYSGSERCNDVRRWKQASTEHSAGHKNGEQRQNGQPKPEENLNKQSPNGYAEVRTSCRGWNHQGLNTAGFFPSIKGIPQFHTTHQPECSLLTNPYSRLTYPVVAVSQRGIGLNPAKNRGTNSIRGLRNRWSLVTGDNSVEHYR